MQQIDVSAFTPDQLDDWLAFFDGPAFADNPDWSTCYCRCFLFGEKGWPAWDAACESGQNRPAMVDEARAGRVDGMLARREGKVVGWIHAGPAERFTSPTGPIVAPEVGLAAIVCFVVAPDERGKGVARALLRGALGELAGRGFTAVEARAQPESSESAAHQFTGPLALYRSEGFVEVGAAGDRVRLRRELRGDVA